MVRGGRVTSCVLPGLPERYSGAHSEFFYPRELPTETLGVPVGVLPVWAAGM
jgi:hypothetical protein